VPFLTFATRKNDGVGQTSQLSITRWSSIIDDATEPNLELFGDYHLPTITDATIPKALVIKEKREVQ